MPLVKLKTRPLFVAEDVVIEHLPKPKFTRQQVLLLSATSKEVLSKQTYMVECVEWSVILPMPTPTTITISAAPYFTYTWSQVVDKYREVYPYNPTSKWIAVNAAELNSALCYWRAVDLLEKAEINRLKANINMYDSISYATTGKGLSEQEIKRLVAEYGFDPEESSGYR